MKFVVFNSDGNPVRTGLCPDEAVAQQAREGELVFEWPPENGKPTDWVVINNELSRKEV